MTTLFPLHSQSEPAIDALLDAAFGTDRHGRTAYAIRTGMRWLPEFSYALADGAGAFVGLLQSWPVALVGDDGVVTPLIMVGPVAVLPARQGEGFGKLLMDRLITDADTSADAPLMMIGDPEYYGRFWGFSADLTKGWRAPGQVEQRRLLARSVPGSALPALLSGVLGPRK
ncbi:N-acetyltransferase [Sphingobium sp. DEHP117]|uniref:GNAT family N-acetyltransferase n=1 Tax=Sphingobium sp. DEHP117 TaxID=2993436 RepID=UPI0027D6ECA3|nr:N-acetyltransferase [Sphingobium sp. DEHP117]MDQ4419658.1 N-acetyltransferase [Sphingobium sp. DEHP117]